MENIVGNHFHIFCLLKDDIVCFNVFISEKCFPLQRSKKLDADESAKCQKAGQTTDGQTVVTVKMQRTVKCNFVVGHLCLIQSLHSIFQDYDQNLTFFCEAQARVRQGSARDGPQGERPQSLNPCLELTLKLVATTHRKSQ